jgi:hypothetical protein
MKRRRRYPNPKTASEASAHLERVVPRPICIPRIRTDAGVQLGFRCFRLLSRFVTPRVIRESDLFVYIAVPFLSLAFPSIVTTLYEEDHIYYTPHTRNMSSSQCLRRLAGSSGQRSTALFRQTPATSARLLRSCATARSLSISASPSRTHVAPTHSMYAMIRRPRLWS